MAITERGQEESKGPALFTVFLFLSSVQVAWAFCTIPVGKHVIELSAAFISQVPNLLTPLMHGSVGPNLLPSPNPSSASRALFHFLHHQIRWPDCASFLLAMIIVALQPLLCRIRDASYLRQKTFVPLLIDNTTTRYFLSHRERSGRACHCEMCFLGERTFP
jgi:hypothetical protein